jgi:hypothetical protein
MAAERHLADSRRIPNLVEKFRNRRYRHSYVASHTRRFLARQMRKLRGDKSQSEFGDVIDKQQTVVSRLEDASYGKWTLQTLFDVAEKLDLAVIARFVDHATFLRFTEDMSDDASAPKPYSQEMMDKIVESEIPQAIVDRIYREQSPTFQPPSRPKQNAEIPAPRQPTGLIQ